MADEVNEEELQAPRAWKRLVTQLGVQSPRKLAAVKGLTRQIRATPKAKRPSGGKG
jgi:hypothetical protein